MKEEDVEKYGKNSSGIFIAAYIMFLILSVAGVILAAYHLQVAPDLTLLQYILNGGW